MDALAVKHMKKKGRSKSRLLATKMSGTHKPVLESLTESPVNAEVAWAPTRGNTLWIPHKEEAYTKSLCYQVENDQVKCEDGTFKRDEVFPLNPETQDGVPDNTQLMYLYDPNLLHNLLVRYNRDEIYTYTAYILIAINPYKNLPHLYTTDLMEKFHQGAMSSLNPHVFGIAERSLRHMKSEKRSQSIIMSGDSGAGKTVSCKYVLRYLTHVAGRGQGTLEKQILEANPVLEAFGNAKTLRNINSSRFGKFIEVHFDAEFKVSGASVCTYLLEKSRLVGQIAGERNYHIFYQLLAGVSAAERSRLHLTSNPEDYAFLSNPENSVIPGVDDSQEFKHVLEAMSLCGLSEAERTQLLNVVAGLLHLGNVEFTGVVHDADGEADDEKCVVSKGSSEALKHTCELFQLEEFALTHCLTTRSMSVSKRGTQYTIPLSVVEASNARDALAKQIYGKVFDWLVDRINNGIPRIGESKLFIGLLDISGFEYFTKNGFEQFLINYCNEKIQQYFTQQILQAEQEIYIKEGLRWRQVEVTDNCETLNLIEQKQTGLLALLEEQCILARADDHTFTSQVHKVHVGHKSLLPPTAKMASIKGLQAKRFRLDEAFVIRHFAADVCYSTKGFLDKNNDTLHKDLIITMQTSKLGLFETIFDTEGVQHQRNRFGTISNKFSEGLATLMDRLNSTTCNFIRCINPSSLAKPNSMECPSVMTQLRCSGMLEALVIMQQGFPTRCLFIDLYNKYKDFMPVEISSLKPSMFCEALLVALDLEGGKDFQMGLSRVFFRAGKLAFMDDLLHGTPASMDQIVKKVRHWLGRKRWKQAIHAVRSINICGKLIEDIREAARLREEQRRLRDEKYQAELRRRQEEERRRMEEEKRKREEEARRRQEEERRRLEEIKRKQEEERKRLEEERRRREEEERKRKEEEARKKAERREQKRIREEKRIAELERLEQEAQKKKELEAELDAEKKAFQDLEADLREKNRASEEVIQDLKGLVSSLQKQLALANDKISILEQEKADLEQRLVVANEEIAELRELMSALEGELASAKNMIDILQQEKSVLTETVATLEENLAANIEKAALLEMELLDARGSIEILEQEKKMLLEENERRANRIRELESNLDSEKSEKEQLQRKMDHELSLKKSEIAQLQEDMVTLAQMKDEEVAQANKEKEETIARLKREFAEEIERIKKQAEETYRTLAEEKEKEIFKIEKERDEQIQKVEVIATKPTKTGWLSKRGGPTNPGWKKRFFLLKSNFLCYYTTNKDVMEKGRKPQGVIDLEKSRVYVSEKSSKRKFIFEIAVPNRVYYIRADTDADRAEWMKAIQMAKARYLQSGNVNLNEVRVKDAKRMSARPMKPTRMSTYLEAQRQQDAASPTSSPRS